MSREEAALYREVATAVGWPPSFPPSVHDAEPDPACPGQNDIQAPGGECVGAYFLRGCALIALPAWDHPEWPEGWRAKITKHESLHSLLSQSTGDSDGEHSRRIWAALGLL